MRGLYVDSPESPFRRAVNRHILQRNIDERLELFGCGCGGGGVLDGFRVSRVVGLHVNYEAA